MKGVAFDTFWRYSPTHMWLHLAVERTPEGERYRICEFNGEPARRWLPTDEPGPKPVDAGGFRAWEDAEGYRLAIMLVRCEAGLISGMRPIDVEKERAALDRIGQGRRPKVERTFPAYEAA